MENFEFIQPTGEEIFYRSNDVNDVRLGEIVSQVEYSQADIVILGCPQDEGVKRNKGRDGARFAPDEIRREFYKFTPFGIRVKIYDAGNLKTEGSLEEIHELQKQIVSKFLRDGKKVIVLGGGGDISYSDGVAMSETFGAKNWLAVSISANLNVQVNETRNNETSYRQLLEENLLRPEYLFESAYQSQFASPVYFRYLQNSGVNLISLEQLRSHQQTDQELRELIKNNFIRHSSSLNIFFGFDLGAVRMSDAPGVSNPSPVGLRAGEFITLVKYAADLMNTRIIEFSEVNPSFDVDHRTVKLVAVAMHRFCSVMSKKG